MLLYSVKHQIFAVFFYVAECGVSHLIVPSACILSIFSILTIIMLLVCNAGYGGGFSTLPSLLSDKFGMKNVSVIHGFALSAWAWAGLCGNQLGNFMITEFSYMKLFSVLTILYLIAYWITEKIIKK
mgnify:CR=1 FL=1